MEKRYSVEKLAAHALRALGNRPRLRKFHLLTRDGRVFSQVQCHLGIPASTLAHHLSILNQANLAVQ